MSSQNTTAQDQYSSNPAYDALNEQMVAATEAGEDGGEDPQLVADTILEAAIVEAPALGWLPGKAAPTIAAAHKRIDYVEWQAAMVEDLQLPWWIEGRDKL